MTPTEIRELAQLHGYQQHHEQPLGIPAPEWTTRGATAAARLRWHLDARGSLIELHRESWRGTLQLDNGFPRSPGHVSQAYISTTQPGVVKGWHLHAHQTDRFVCLRGRVLLATCQLPAKVLEHNPVVTVQILEPLRGTELVEVPPGVAHGWRALGDDEAWVLNLCSHEYDGTDEWRRAPHAGPVDMLAFNWAEEVDG